MECKKCTDGYINVGCIVFRRRNVSFTCLFCVMKIQTINSRCRLFFSIEVNNLGLGLSMCKTSPAARSLQDIFTCGIIGNRYILSNTFFYVKQINNKQMLQVFLSINNN